MSLADIATPARAIGVILPSSNRTVERVTRAVLDDVPDTVACFTRVPYDHPPDGYHLAPFDAAAAMLADARVDAICWNATRGALLGFEPDRKLCRRLTDATGIPVITTALATPTLLRAHGLTRIALITQGDAAEARRLTETFAAEGITLAAARALDVVDNFDAALVLAERIRRFARELATEASPDAILVWSTNLPGFDLAAGLEAETGIPIIDSCTVGVTAALAEIGADTGRLATLGDHLMPPATTRNDGATPSVGHLRID